MAFTINPKSNSVSISIANTNLDGTGTITTLFTAVNAPEGSVLNAVRIQATGDVPLGMIRLFIRPNAGSWTLVKEIPVPATTRSAQYTAYAETIAPECFLASQYEIGVSTETATTYKVTAFGYDITGFI
jgi:hypothetical protein